MIATWTRSGQTDRPSGNSFKASPTSNGGRDKDHYLSDSHLLLLLLLLWEQLTKMPCHNPEIGSLSVLSEDFQRLLYKTDNDMFICLGVSVFPN